MRSWLSLLFCHAGLSAPALALALLIAPRAAHALGSCGVGGESPGSTKLSDWNGTDYIVRVPSCYTTSRPIPAMIHLHGDGGGGDIIVSGSYWGSLYQSECFLLFAPNAVKGGKGSWSPNTKPGSCGMSTEWQCREALLDKFIDEVVLGKYNVDLDRIYLAGWSGGAVFLSFYPLIKGRQEKFAGVGYNFCASDGWWDKRYGVARPECKIPAYYVALDDWLRAECKQHADRLKGLGHEVAYKEVNQPHGSITPEMVGPEWAFFKAHPLCGAARGDGCAGGPAADGGPDGSDAGHGGGADGGGGGGAGPPDAERDDRAQGGDMVGGCGCAAGGAKLPDNFTLAFLVVALLAVVLLRRSSRSARSVQVELDRAQGRRR